jgi:hypothetical protein
MLQAAGARTSTTFANGHRLTKHPAWFYELPMSSSYYKLAKSDLRSANISSDDSGDDLVRGLCGLLWSCVVYFLTQFW